jgi:hypothetical protein
LEAFFTISFGWETVAFFNKLNSLSLLIAGESENKEFSSFSFSFSIVETLGDASFS